jgi:hypothetical protein
MNVIRHDIDTEERVENSQRLKDLYKKYNMAIRQYSQTAKKEKIDKKERQIRRQIFKQTFKEQAYKICSNEDELCDIVIDLCYQSNTSKQFAWDIVGKTIISNLLKKNNYKLNYPSRDDNGDIEFGGYRFSMQEKYVGSEDEIE